MIPISEEEKQRCFIRDFTGYIPEVGRRYYKLHDDVKIHSLQDITNPEVFETIRKKDQSFQNVFYSDHWRYSHIDDFDFDDEGFLRYVWCGDKPIIEHELAKMATAISYEEGKEHYEHEQCMKELLLEEQNLKRKAEEYYKLHKKRFKTMQKQNSNLTPIEFMIQEENREKEAKQILVRKLTHTIKKYIDNVK